MTKFPRHQFVLQMMFFKLNKEAKKRFNILPEKIEDTKTLKIIDQEWVLETTQDEESKNVVDHHVR